MPQGGDDEQVEMDEVLHLTEKKNSKKGAAGKQLTRTRSNNIDEFNKNVCIQLWCRQAQIFIKNLFFVLLLRNKGLSIMFI